MKRLIFLGALALVASACAAVPSPTSPPNQGGVEGTQPPEVTTTVAQQAPDSTEPPTAEMPISTEGSLAPPIPADAPDAPDFVFTLGDGTEYHLGSDSKPVYLIFWAEW